MSEIVVRRRRSLGAVCLTVAALATLAAPAGARDRVYDLDRPIAVTGKATGYVHVRLPVPLALTSGGLAVIELHGGARGALLLRDDDRQRTLFLFVRAPRSRMEQYLNVVEDPASGTAAPPAARHLPPGRYRLYVITSGPGTVVVRPGRVSGKPRTVGPDHLTGSAEKHFDGSVSGTSGSFGAVVTVDGGSALRSRGIAISHIAASGPAAKGHDVQACYYDHEPLVKAYPPGCVNGGTGVAFTNVSTQVPYRLSAFSFLPTDKGGTWWSGMTARIAGASTETSGWLAWISYD